MSDNPQEPSQPENLEQIAEGSGMAAMLAFFNVCVAGALAYGAFYLLKHATPSLLFSNNVVLQFLFPAWLAVVLCFPTDPLTAVLARLSRASGYLAIVVFLVAVGIAFFAAPANTLGWGDGATVLGHLAGAYLAAAAFGEVARPSLRGTPAIELKELAKQRLLVSGASIAVAGILALYVLDGLAAKWTLPETLYVILAVLGSITAAWLSCRTFRRAPVGPSPLYSTVALAAGFCVLLGCMLPDQRFPGILAWFVGCMFPVLAYYSMTPGGRSRMAAKEMTH